MIVKNRSDSEFAEFDLFMKESKDTGRKLGKYIEQVYLRRGMSIPEGKTYGAAFREHVIEHVRAEVCPTAPRRRESFFAGLEKSHIEKFEQLAPRDSSILVIVEVIQCDAAFLGDMALLDEFEVFEHDYKQARSIVERYWLKERTQDPCLELLIQGHFKWGSFVSTR